ncbi:MAG: hypothetical protein KDK30_08515 [Leptospiraceae bacterium]|nr:hypothetical protein [Leptospiraceae bacterium]
MSVSHSESRSSFDRKLTEYIQECVLLYHAIHRADERVHGPTGLSHADFT